MPKTCLPAAVDNLSSDTTEFHFLRKTLALISEPPILNFNYRNQISIKVALGPCVLFRVRDKTQLNSIKLNFNPYESAEIHGDFRKNEKTGSNKEKPV